MDQIFQWYICYTGSVSLSQSTLPDICLTESSIADLQGIYQQGCFYNTLIRLSIFLSPSKTASFVNVRDGIFFFFTVPFCKKPFEVKLFK